MSNVLSNFRRKPKRIAAILKWGNKPRKRQPHKKVVHDSAPPSKP